MRGATSDLDFAKQFRDALEAALRTGERDGVLELVTPDVEWVTPQASVRGIEELRSWRAWGLSAETFDFEFSDGEWSDLGGGRILCDLRQVYRMKDSGEVAYERNRKVELTIREGKVCRYELRFTG